MFVSTFGVTDPILAHAGQVIIKEGVPYRQGVRKHNIIDGDTRAWALKGSPGGLSKLHDSGETYRVTESHVPVRIL